MRFEKVKALEFWLRYESAQEETEKLQGFVDELLTVKVPQELE